MKSVFFLLFTASNMIAMKEPNCYFAHQKFLTMLQTCKHKWGQNFGIDEQKVKERQQCTETIFKQFQKECIQEEQTRNETAK